MKRIVKYILILSLLISVIGFATSAYANGKQDEVEYLSSSEFNEVIEDFNIRIAKVEELSKDEIIRQFIDNENNITSRATFWMSVIGVMVAVAAFVGGFMPYFSQKRNEKEFRQTMKALDAKQREFQESLEILNKQIQALNKIEEYRQKDINEAYESMQQLEKEVLEALE